MAPFLTSHNELEETVSPSITKSRPLKSIVPVIPRALEKKAKRVHSPLDKASSSNSEHGKPEDLDHPLKSPVEICSSLISQIPCQKIQFQGFDEEAETALGTVKIPHGSSIKHTLQDFGIEKHGHQLPPPFYPADQRFSINGIAVNTLEDDNTLPGPSTIFPCKFDRPVIFGEKEESDGSSATPPQSTTSTALAQPTPPSDIPSSPTQSTYQGYGHVKSTPRQPVTSTSPVSMAYPYDFPGNSQIYVPLAYGYGIPSSSYSHQMAFTPRGSQPPFAPSTTSYRDQSLEYSDSVQGTVFEPRYASYSQPIEVVGERQHNYDITFATTLISHLSLHFNNPEYADCQLEIQAGNQQANLKLHALLIGRSPTIRTLFDSATGFTETGRNQLSLRTSDQFVTIPAIVSALRVCYGKSPADVSPDLNWSIPLDLGRSDVGSLMDYALAYTAAGYILQMPETAINGADMVTRLLCFVTLEKVLEFALSGSPCSSNDSEHKDMFALDLGTYAPHSGRILQATLEFLVMKFPINFLLDTSVAGSRSLCELPTVEYSQNSTSSSRSKLSRIQFGDFPSEISDPPSAENTILSRLLLSVPFTVLEYILDLLERPISQRISEPIIKERERRRQAAPVIGGISVPGEVR